MSDDTPDDLRHLIDALKTPVPVAAGLAGRARLRARRSRRLHLAQGATVILLAAAVVAGWQRRGRGDVPVHFTLDAPSVHSVALVGDFTDWQADRVNLRETTTGVWQATVKLRPGRYRFSYLVDHDQWRADPGAASAPDDFGRPTSAVTVEAP